MKTPRSDAIFQKHGCASFAVADFARQLEQELNESKKLMETAAAWIEVCPFENSWPLAEKLRAAARQKAL